MYDVLLLHSGLKRFLFWLWFKSMRDGAKDASGLDPCKNLFYWLIMYFSFWPYICFRKSFFWFGKVFTTFCKLWVKDQIIFMSKNVQHYSDLFKLSLHYVTLHYVTWCIWFLLGTGQKKPVLSVELNWIQGETFEKFQFISVALTMTADTLPTRAVNGTSWILKAPSTKLRIF